MLGFGSAVSSLARCAKRRQKERPTAAVPQMRRAGAEGMNESAASPHVLCCFPAKYIADLFFYLPNCKYG